MRNGNSTGIAGILGGLSMNKAPTALREAVARVREQHPYAASGEIALDTKRVAQDADALWQRLISLDGATRESAVVRMASHELRLLAATAPGRLGNSEVREVLALLLGVHTLPDAADLAWRAYLIGDGDQASLRDHAAAAVRLSGEARKTWSRLLEAKSPIEELIAMWTHPGRKSGRRSVSGSFDEWVAEPAVGLVQYPIFLNMVRRALLEERHLLVLDEREDSRTILNWMTMLVPAGEQTKWLLSFLSATCPRRGGVGRGWEELWPPGHAVCEMIYQSMQPPGNGSPFWDAASADVIWAFQLWLKNGLLTTFLGGENDRVQFWRRYLISIRKIERTRDEAVVFLHFDGWTAVQFVNTGRATFLFREQLVRGWFRKPEPEVYKLALGYRAKASPFFLGSYQHRGQTVTWQYFASEIVSDVQAQLNGGKEPGGGL